MRIDVPIYEIISTVSIGNLNMMTLGKLLNNRHMSIVQILNMNTGIMFKKILIKYVCGHTYVKDMAL